VIYSGEAWRLFSEEAARYGVQVNFDIVQSPQTVFTWGWLKLSQRALYLPSREHLRMLIRHKLGYRVYFPGSHELEKVAMIVASGKGIMAPQCFAYLCSDFFTALNILLNEGLDGESKKTYVEAVLSESERVDPKTVWLLKCYVLSMLSGIPAYGFMSVEAGGLVDLAKKVVDTLLSSSSIAFKLVRLADLLADLLNKEFKNVEDLRRLPEIFPLSSFETDKPLTMLSEIPVEVLENAASSLYSKGSGNTISFKPDRVLVQAIKISLHDKILSARKSIGLSESGRYYGTWTIGDDPSKLLVRDTLRAFGVVAPPLYSLKLVDGEGVSETSSSSLCIVLDVSSSMLFPPSKAVNAKAGAIGLVEELKSRRTRLSICFFNASHLLKTYGYGYGDAVDDIASVIISGDTDLHSALEEASKTESETMFVITDAEISDPVERGRVLDLLQELSDKARVNVFLIDDGKNSWIDGRGWRTYHLKASEPIVDKTIGLVDR
jgi:Mg-chelatase subunit ChlD